MLLKIALGSDPCLNVSRPYARLWYKHYKPNSANTHIVSWKIKKKSLFRWIHTTFIMFVGVWKRIWFFLHILYKNTISGAFPEPFSREGGWVSLVVWYPDAECTKTFLSYYMHIFIYYIICYYKLYPDAIIIKKKTKKQIWH